MATGYIPLPAARYPQNAMLNFQPVNQAIDSVHRMGMDKQNAMLAKRADARAQTSQGMAQERLGMARTQFQQGQEDRQREMFAKRAMAAYQEQDPAKRAQIWQSVISRHPGRDGLDQVYLDPTTGPQQALAEAGMLPDNEKRHLQMDLLRAQISKANASGASSEPTFGRSGQVFQDDKGNFFTVQFGSNGERRILPVTAGEGAPLEPSRGVTWIDDGMTQTPVSKSTGAPASTAAPIPNRIGDAEAAKIEGRETAEGKFALPKLRRGMEMQAEQTRVVAESIDQAIKLAGEFGTTGFIGDWTQSIGGTRAHDLQQTLNTVRGNLGFDKLQNIRDNSPTGGALGQVAVMELQMLQSVWGSVQQSQSADVLIANLNRIKELQSMFMKMKRNAYKEDVARFGAENVPDIGIDPEGGGETELKDLKSKYGLE